MKGQKAELDYMVVPEDLEKCGLVKNKVMLRILDKNHHLLDGYLGESGQRLAEVGARWYFKQHIALRLVAHGAAELVTKQ